MYSENAPFQCRDLQPVLAGLEKDEEMNLHSIAALMLIGLALLAPSPSAAQTSGPNICGNPFVNHFGPFDYRSATTADRQIVEGRHFTAGIESLTTPSTTTRREMAQDVAYTLAVFPNHHRALITMTRLADRYKIDPAPGTKMTVDCWFDRALRFRPDDTVSRALYAQFLLKKNRKEEALQQLGVAASQAKDNPFTHYNLGLLYLESGDFENASLHARRARELGAPQTQLIDQLKAAGKWVETTPSEAKTE
jgi:tetratricopeptide (TPR) repeat protein